MRLGKEAVKYARPKIRSQTLKRALAAHQAGPNVVYVGVPHYWAVYVHNGRGPITMPEGKVMCWFRNIADDPRLPGGTYPVNRGQRRRMTQQEFLYWLEQNRQAVAAGAEPPMVITRHVGPVAPNRFLANDGGMAGFMQKAQQVAGPLVRKYLLGQLRDVLNIEDTAGFSLRY